MTKTILIVDDEEIFLSTVREFLEKSGYYCFIASHSSEAMNIIKRHMPDLVISDIVMPDVDGIQLMHAAKKEFPDLNFIISTGYQSEYSYVEIIDAGASDYITKPFELKELTARIERIDRERKTLFELRNTNIQLKTTIDRANEMAAKAKMAEGHIRILTQELIRAQESERLKISHDLHDNVAQNLSALKLACETLFHDQPSVSDELVYRISKLSKILQECINSVRDLSYDLRPPGLSQLGLVRTVYQYCEEFSNENEATVDFSSTGMDDLKLDFDTEINLYRVVQEALNNVRKHSDADHVTIRLEGSIPHIVLKIEDDGKGFDPKKRLLTALNEKRMGLRSMEERISLLNGKMSIQSHPMQGTKILIKVPRTEDKGDH
ncbi:MAG: response regulator [Thermodesulfobacteriota bacterium]|nr:response regulator [Thermodesulfobacteriota bacterium]